MNEDVYYRHTLDSMTKNQIVRLVNIADGSPISFTDDWTWAALSDRGLVISFSEWQELHFMALETGMKFLDIEIANQMTDYGRAFVAWYRHPHDTPQQLELL